MGTNLFLHRLHHLQHLMVRLHAYHKIIQKLNSDIFANFIFYVIERIITLLKGKCPLCRRMNIFKE